MYRQNGDRQTETYIDEQFDGNENRQTNREINYDTDNFQLKWSVLKYTYTNTQTYRQMDRQIRRLNK